MEEFPPMKMSARGLDASVLMREAMVPACSIWRATSAVRPVACLKASAISSMVFLSSAA